MQSGSSVGPFFNRLPDTPPELAVLEPSLGEANVPRQEIDDTASIESFTPDMKLFGHSLAYVTRSNAKREPPPHSDYGE